MTNYYDLLLSKALCLFTKKNITYSDIQSIMPKKESDLYILKKYKANCKIIKSNTNASHVYILLMGKARCVVDSYLGEREIIDIMNSPYIFGLLEYMVSIKKYTASIITYGKETWILSVPMDVFVHAIKNSITASNMCLSFFTSVASYYMEMAEMVLYDHLDKIALYIYKNCDKNLLPYKIDITRKTMGYILDINLRTLYRYLQKLEKDNYFSIVNGKIFINVEQYKKLKSRFSRYSILEHNSKQVYTRLFDDSK